MGKNNKVLSINNINIENLGIFKDFFRNDGYVIEEINASYQQIPENVNKYDAIFILGGPMSANDDFDYLKREKTLIKKTLDDHIPLMGICLGSQLIASVCGGSVYKGNKKEIGWYNVKIKKDGQNNLFSSFMENEIEVFQWHGETFVLPPDAEILSASDLYTQAFKINTAFGIQFHFEVTKDMILNWIKEYANELVMEKIPNEVLINQIDIKIKKLNSTAETIYKNFISYVERYG